jgi:hypothetical protein
MNSRFNGSMGYQRLIKEIKRDVGGGPPGPDSVGTSQIINGTITTADIALGTIDISNLSASCIASLSGGGGGLTANSVNSSHIINGSILTIDICDNAITNAKIAHNAVGNTNVIDGAITHVKLSSNCVESHNIKDRTILGIDISLGQIGEAHFDASFTEQLIGFAGVLEEIGDAIKELSKPFGIIRIINESLAEDNFDYELYVYNVIDEEYDSLASAIRLKKNDSFTHFYQVANKYTTMKLVVSNSVDVLAFNMLQGAENVNDDGNELIFQIGESTKYQNIEIGVEVEVTI